MNTRIRSLILAGTLSAALVACGDDTKLDERVVDGETPGLEAGDEVVTVFNPLDREYTLTPEQQTRRAAFDMTAFQRDFEREREAIIARGDPSDLENPATPTPDTPMSSPTGAAQQGIPPRQRMNFAFLDRNEDERLSVAEYAIWAVGVDPTEPKPNDQRQPFIAADQANRAADSFFYFDADGDTYLSQNEFVNARTGGSAGGTAG